MAYNYLSSEYYTHKLCQQFMNWYRKRGINWVRAWPEKTLYKGPDGKNYPIVSMATNLIFTIPKERGDVRLVG